MRTRLRQRMACDHTRTSPHCSVSVLNHRLTGSNLNTMLLRPSPLPSDKILLNTLATTPLFHDQQTPHILGWPRHTSNTKLPAHCTCYAFHTGPPPDKKTLSAPRFLHNLFVPGTPKSSQPTQMMRLQIAQLKERLGQRMLPFVTKADASCRRNVSRSDGKPTTWLQHPLHQNLPNACSDSSQKRPTSLLTFQQPLCQRIHAQSRDAMEREPTNQRTSRTIDIRALYTIASHTTCA